MLNRIFSPHDFSRDLRIEWGRGGGKKRKRRGGKEWGKKKRIKITKNGKLIHDVASVWIDLFLRCWQASNWEDRFGLCNACREWRKNDIVSLFWQNTCRKIAAQVLVRTFKFLKINTIRGDMLFLNGFKPVIDPAIKK